MPITVSRPIVIKAIVTESFKRLYRQELDQALNRVDEILTEITTQIRRSELERQISPQARTVRQQLEMERSRHEATRIELQARLREVDSLDLNTEFSQGTVEGLTEIAIG